MHGLSGVQSGRFANNEKSEEEKHNNVAGTGIDNASSGGNESLAGIYPTQKPSKSSLGVVSITRRDLFTSLGRAAS